MWTYEDLQKHVANKTIRDFYYGKWDEPPVEPRQYFTPDGIAYRTPLPTDKGNQNVPESV